MKKNVASQSVGVQMVAAADGTAFTGTVTVLITIDNLTQTASAGTAPAHEGNGYHSYSPTAGETDGDHLAFTFTGTGAIPATIQTYTGFPQTVDNATGIADIPTVAEFDARTILTADYFDPAVDAVANVTLVATTTTNTDVTALNNVAATDIVSAGAITTLAGAVVNVDLVDTVTTNTDKNTLAATDIVSAGAITTLTGAVVNVDLVDTVTTNTDKNTLAATDIVSSGAITTLAGAVVTVTNNTDMVGTNGANTVVPMTAAANLAEHDATQAAVVIVDGNVDLIKTTTDQFAFTVANQVDSNALAISGDAAAADNLEATYDGTGYTNDFAPATQAQVGRLSVGAGGISISADSFTLTIGTESAGTVAVTEELNGTVHTIDTPAANLDFYYEFNVGVNGIATEVLWDGYVGNNGDLVEIYGWDWISSSYKQVGSVSGKNADSVEEHVFLLTQSMTGTGANSGVVRLRFESSGADVAVDINTDRIWCEFTSVAAESLILHSGIAQAGSSNTITLDTGASAIDDFYNNARTIIASGLGSEQERIIVSYIGSTKVATISPPWVTNPDSTSAFDVEAASVHTASDHQTVKVGIAQAGASTTITLDTLASAVDDFYKGDAVDLHSGTGKGQSRIIVGYDQATKVATVSKAWIVNPDSTTEYFIQEASVDVEAVGGEAASATATVDFDDINSLLESLVMQKTTIATLASQTEFTLTAGSADNDAYGGATIVIVDSATAEQKAFGSISGYVGSTKTITMAQDPGVFTMAVGDTAYVLTSDVFAILDRLLTGATHNVTNSTAKRIRESSGFVIYSATAQAGSTTNTIVLDTGASGTDGAYDPAGISILSGTGAGQTRLILQYDGASKTAVVDRNWKAIPDATSEFIVTADSGREHVNEGQLQSATSTTATLNTLASSADSTYSGQQIFLRSGTGDDQVRTVSEYNGTTKVAIIYPEWNTTPDATTGYSMLPIFRPASTLTQGTAQAATSGTITLNTSASSVDDFYNHSNLAITAGTGKSQERIIADYDQATKVATITPVWTTTPDATSQYSIVRGQSHGSTTNGGYLDASVWVDTVNGTAGTLQYVNGTSTRPVSNLADAFTIATGLNLSKFNIQAGSTVTLPADSTSREFEGRSYGVLLNSADIDGSSFTGSSSISGIATAGSSNAPSFFSCAIGSVTLPPSNGFQCGFFGTFTLGLAGSYTWGGSATVFNLPFVIDYGAALNSSSFFLQSWGGGPIEIQNAGTGTGTYILDLNGQGELTINANCSATTEVDLHGNITLTNNATGVTINDSTNSVEGMGVDVLSINSSSLAAQNLALTASRMVPGTIDDSTFTPTISVFEVSDITEATPDHYNGRIIIFTSQDLNQQAAAIQDYELSVNSKGKFTVTALTEIPANGTTMMIV